MKFDTLDNLVKDICAMNDDPEFRRYVKVARFTRRALNELSEHAVPNIRSIVVTIEDGLLVNMPAECDDVLKIGVPSVDGKLRILGRNDADYNLNRIKTKNALGCTCIDSTTTATTTVGSAANPVNAGTTCNICTFHNVWSGNEYFGEYFGYRPTMFKNGTFSYDELSNQVQLNSGYDVQPGYEIVVEYKSSLENDKYQLVPRKAFAVIRHRVMQWLTDKDPGGVSERHFTQFKSQWKMLKRTYDQYSLEDWMAAFRGQYSPTIRR